MDAQGQEVPETTARQCGFKSPIRTLAGFFRKSQQKWKRKAIERRAKIKGMEHKVRDIDASRTGWKNKAQQLATDNNNLQERLQEVEAERSRLQGKVEELESKKA